MPKIAAPTLAEHHAQRRAAILAAATGLLQREGAPAVTPAAVAAGSGLARSSVYQYYPSTGALLGAAVEEMFASAVQEIQASVAAADSPLERVLAYLDAALELARDGHGATGALPADLPVPPECAERVRLLHDALVEPLTSALSDSGVDNPVSAAAFVNGVVGAAAALIDRGQPADRVRAEMRHFATHGLYPAGS
ncbi:MAG: TetR/AcrR family transcriptional regulator [Nocardioides sp.]